MIYRVSTYASTKEEELWLSLDGALSWVWTDHGMSVMIAWQVHQDAVELGLLDVGIAAEALLDILIPNWDI